MSNDIRKNMEMIESLLGEDSDNNGGMEDWLNSYGIDFELASEDIDAIAQPGDNEQAVREVMDQDYVKAQLDQMDNEKVKDAVREMFADIEEDELEDSFMNKMRLVWMAAWDMYEERNESD